MGNGKDRNREEQIRLRLEQIEEMRKEKLPWGKIASKLNKVGLKPLNGEMWTIDSVFSFYIIMSRKRHAKLLAKILDFPKKQSS